MIQASVCRSSRSNSSSGRARYRQARSLLPALGFAAAQLLLASVAQAGPVVGGADSAAQGGVTRASLRSLGSVLTAPALLALKARYEVQVSGELGPDSLMGVKAYALDSTTGPISLGIGYQYAHTVPITQTSDLPGWLLPDDDLSNETASTVFGGGLATSFGERRLGVGLGFSWLNNASRFADTQSWFQGSASVAGRVGPDETLILSLVADNLLNPANAETPMTFGGGASWRPVEPFGLAGQVDVVTGDFSRPAQLGFGAGVEGLVAEVVALRGGFKRDVDRASDLVTLGLGTYSDEMSLDYSAELVVGHADQTPPGWDDGRFRHQHMLSLTLKL